MSFKLFITSFEIVLAVGYFNQREKYINPNAIETVQTQFS